MLDGDEAGRRRANEVLELFLAARADLRVLTLPGEADPCEYLLEHGAEALHSLIAAAPDALSHAIATATAGIDVTRDVHGSSQALEKLVETIAKAPRPTQGDDHVRESAFLSHLARKFSVREEDLRTRMKEVRSRASDRRLPACRADETASMRAADLDPAERELLEILLHYPAGMAMIAERLSFAWLSSAVCRHGDRALPGMAHGRAGSRLCAIVIGV